MISRKSAKIITAAALLGCWVLPQLSLAGNKEMVEKEVATLDAENKEVVSVIPELPDNGKISVKARVKGERDGGGIVILESNLIESKTGKGNAPETKQESIEFK